MDTVNVNVCQISYGSLPQRYTMQSCELTARQAIVFTFYFPLLEYNLIQHLNQ